MSGIAPVAFMVLFAFQFLGTVAYLFLIASLFKRLKASHAPVWEALGSPSLFLNNNIRNNWLVLRWLWTKRYMDLQEPDTIDLAAAVRAVLFTLLANLAVLVVLFLVIDSAKWGRLPGAS
jgi:hypothetical protein